MNPRPLSLTRGRWSTPLSVGHVHAWRPGAGGGRWVCADCPQTTVEAPTLAWAASTVTCDADGAQGLLEAA